MQILPNNQLLLITSIHYYINDTSIMAVSGMADKVFKNKMKSCIGSSKITKLKNKRPIEEVYSDVFDTAVDEFPNVLKKQNNAKSIETRIPDLNITNKKKYKKGKSKRTDVSDSIISEKLIEIV